MHLVWFRTDLRLTDNPALFYACEHAMQHNKPVCAVFFICEKQWLAHDMGDIKVSFLLEHVKDLHKRLAKLNIPLVLLKTDWFGQIPELLIDLCREKQINHVYSNIEYEINEKNRDTLCQQQLSALNIQFHQYHDQCLLSPGSVTTKTGGMYKVFTPFYKCWQGLLDNASIQALPQPFAVKPISINVHDTNVNIDGTDIELSQFKILNHYLQDFPIGEAHAMRQLADFIAHHSANYKSLRDQPAQADATSRLSAYLAVGAISPKQCYIAAKNKLQGEPLSDDAKKSIQHWISEVCWREFYRHIIATWPAICKHHAFNVATDKKVAWRYDQVDFTAWCDGKTGFPLVDAAMRCLNATGFMHNRLRMVTAMFLTKDLLIDWRWGERYFMQQLIDADFASNNGGWQWSASVGTDAAPYFRIMNPFSQAKTHDPDALFIKAWLPELDGVQPNTIHDPKKLASVCDVVGYIKPIVDHKMAREKAIAAFK